MERVGVASLVARIAFGLVQYAPVNEDKRA